MLALTGIAVVWLSASGASARGARSGGPAVVRRARVLERLIEGVPSVGSGRVAYDARDDQGDALDALDPIEDPTGGYLGVYHAPFGWIPRLGQSNFRIVLGFSADLVHWHQVAVLDPIGATMPTLRPIPGAPGYLLGYEKSEGRKLRHVVRVRYYATLGDLAAGRFAAQVDLPRELSRFNEGTPSLYSISWRGSLARSIVELGFHYESAWRGQPGADREGFGTLVGFRRWSPSEDGAIDALIDQQGLTGSHGDERQFSFDGYGWRVYEAQQRYDDFSTWHLLLYGGSSIGMRQLTLTTAGGSFRTSFGNPIVRVLRARVGGGQVLAVTMFIFGSGAAARESGEVVYYQPL